MIGVLAPHSATIAADLVTAALVRSLSASQVRRISPAAVESLQPKILLIINPPVEWAEMLLGWLESGCRKLVIFGQLPDPLIEHFKLERTTWPDLPEEWSRSAPAPTYGFSESTGEILYEALAEKFYAGHWRRPMERFDFTDEWNNLGYGAIRADDSIWALADPLVANNACRLASVFVGECNIATYSALFEDTKYSALWFNREVGPIDSYEWCLVERFLASWRHEELPCNPVLQEIPWGYEAAVTMRLDCDEDIESARSLREAYHAMGVPFSLAVHTANLDNPSHHAILREMASAGESILSHTATHAPNWGGSYEAALVEARESCLRLQAVTGQLVRYAVSPFHQSPPYALAALADVGFSGCIGGIIRNDPEFLLARGGSLADLPNGFVGHSQQHMLHGDCMLTEGDPLAIFKQAFDRAKETSTIFGYLDHPFSERYQYGWTDEATRIAVHQALIEYIRSSTPSTLFLSENDALDFLASKSEWQVLEKDSQFMLQSADLKPIKLVPTVEFAGRQFGAVAGKVSA